ncbi:hypothetical protein FQN49_006696 [Arthroderma sp. PD_2]|nr:hypothetical protein FQN49_006696 [Arthroderma sp. PD_2]
MGIDSQQSSFTDDAPPSDSDSYFSNSEYSENGHASPFAKFPTRVVLPPYSFSKRIFYWSEDSYQRSLSRQIVTRMDFASVVLNRYPTQEETDAWVSQASSAQTFPGYGAIIGLGVGAMIAKTKDARAATMANETAAQQFASKRPLFKLSPHTLKGRLARAAVILPIFSMIGAALSDVFGEVYIRIKGASDPRLARFRDEVLHADTQQVQARIRRYQAEKLAAIRRHSGNTPSTTQPQQSGYHDANDTSPTGSYEQQGASGSSHYQSQYGPQSGYSNQPASTDSNILKETNRTQAETPDYSGSYPNSNDYSGNRRRQQAIPIIPDSSSSSTGEKSFWDDDASPVNSDFTPNPADSSSTSPSGSAWARIRQQSMGDSSPNNGGYSDSSSSTWERRQN